jgi:hypothetical protein
MPLSSDRSPIEAIDFFGKDGEELLVKTAGLYRIVKHNSDGTDEIDDELLSAEEAIRDAEIQNGMRWRDDGWYEVVSYKEAARRESREQYDDEINERVEKRLADRLAAAKKKQRPKVKRKAK